MARIGIFFGVLLLVLLTFRINTFYNSLPKFSTDKVIHLEGNVSSIPSTGPRSQRLLVQSDSGVKLYVTTSAHKEYFYGQRILLSGKAKEVVLDSGKVILTVSFPKIQPKPRGGEFGELVDGFYKLSDRVRGRIISFYEANLPRNSAAFLSGVVLGVDNGMTKEYREMLISLGVVHVVAASGMNVAIVAGVFFAFFSIIFSRKSAVIFSIVAIAFYIVLAGGQASIIRAGIMGSIAFAASLFGRQYYGFLALFLTGILMLFVSPLYIEDAGFQLSFLSTLGLLFIPKFLESTGTIRSGAVKLVSFFKEDFLLTFSAQIATLPVLFYHFGSYNLLSLVVNLLVLWVIPPLMILGGTAGILSIVVPFMGKVVMLFSIPFLYYFELIINTFSRIPVAVEVRMPIVLVVTYYFLLSCILLYKSGGKKQT